jgi:hypothetical protein
LLADLPETLQNLAPTVDGCAHGCGSLARDSIQAAVDGQVRYRPHQATPLSIFAASGL